MGGGKKVGAYSILTTMLIGFLGWLANLGNVEIPELKTEIQVHRAEILNNKNGITEIKSDLSKLREGQTKILEILVERK